MICSRYDNGKCASAWCYYKSAGDTCLNPRLKRNQRNADRIRGMSDEELAGIIAAEFTAEKIPFCKDKAECMEILEHGVIPEEMCLACALDWLQQPAEETP